MDYEDVKGPLPRYWKVRDNPDPAATNLDLSDGDLLVFGEEKPGTITKFKPKLQSEPRHPPEEWATECREASPADGFDYAISGMHKSGKQIRIDFKAENDQAGAFHKGTVLDSADQLFAITWMSDEGP